MYKIILRKCKCGKTESGIIFCSVSSLLILEFFHRIVKKIAKMGLENSRKLVYA